MLNVNTNCVSSRKVQDIILTTIGALEEADVKKAIISCEFKDNNCIFTLKDDDDNFAEVIIPAKLFLREFIAQLSYYSEPKAFEYASTILFGTDLEKGLIYAVSCIPYWAGISYTGVPFRSQKEIKDILKQEGIDLSYCSDVECLSLIDDKGEELYLDDIDKTILEQNECSPITPVELVKIMDIDWIPEFAIVKDAILNQLIQSSESALSIMPKGYRLNQGYIEFKDRSVHTLKFIQGILHELGIYNAITQIAWCNNIFQDAKKLNYFIEVLIAIAGMEKVDSVLDIE